MDKVNTCASCYNVTYDEQCNQCLNYSRWEPRAGFGVKDDTGKPMCALVLGDFSNALLAVSEVGTFGAKKYTEHGWLSVQKAEQRYADAMLRHWLQSSQCPNDAESGQLHLAHMAWNALAILELQLRKCATETAKIK